MARNAIQVGTESYGLKCLERLTDFERGHDIDQGAGAVVEYESYMADGDPADLDRIAAYNEDDVRATLALRDWLVEHRPPDLAWRKRPFETEPRCCPSSTSRSRRSTPSAGGHPSTFSATCSATGGASGGPTSPRNWPSARPDTAELLDDPEVDRRAHPIGLRRRGSGRRASCSSARRMRFTFPAADPGRLPARRRPGAVPRRPTAEWLRAASIASTRARGRARPEWNEEQQERGLAPYGRRPQRLGRPEARSQRLALSELASRLIGSATRPTASTGRCCGANCPRFATGGGPAGGVFTDDLDEMIGWATQLDHSYVAIQGPPGTGKTFRAPTGPHAVLAGKRVGITAMSHHAIDNLLDEIIESSSEKADLEQLHGDPQAAVPGSTRTTPDGFKQRPTSKTCAKDRLQPGRRDDLAVRRQRRCAAAPVDVLLIDEAGQLALADALAASPSARNLILLGDPLQLPQVSQAVHPGGGGRSVLEHVLGDDVTMPDDRGVFLTETRRMHPDVCRFISDEIYEGRLHSHPSCASQTTVAGTGLRWLRADTPGDAHRVDRGSRAGRRRDQPADRHRLDQPDGTNSPLDRRRLHGRRAVQRPGRTYRRRLDSDPRTRGVPVGTVDKFQGREAAVVFFTMTTSSGADMTRGGGLPVLPQPAQCRHQPGPLPRLPGVHRGATERPRPHRGRHAADRDPECLRRMGTTPSRSACRSPTIGLDLLLTHGASGSWRCVNSEGVAVLSYAHRHQFRVWVDSQTLIEF